MSDTPPMPSASAPRKGFWARLRTSRFLVVSVMIHVLLILIAGFVVVQVISTKRKQNFTAAPAGPQNRAVEHRVQMAKKQQSMAAPMTKRVVTTGLSKVALPEMPDLAASADLANPVTATSGAAPGMGLGSSMGGGSGSGGGGAPLFGFRDSRAALEGTFYDLKQNRSRKPNPKWNEKSYRAFVATFARRGMSEGLLAPYYRGKDKLYAPQIMMPSIPADAGPKGFGVDRDVAPSYWLVVYKAKVSPPRSGVVHFVGACDDVMLVKFQGRLVLDGSLYHGLGEWKAGKEYPYDNYVRNTYLAKLNAGGWARSDAIKVEAGQWYDLVVAIGEAPGGFFDASLLIEEEGVAYEKDAKGNPILPPFRLSNVKVPDDQFPRGKGPTLPPSAPNGPIWKVRGESGMSGLGLP